MTSGSMALIDRRKYEWLFRYKIYHLPFWFLYNYFFWILVTGSMHSPLFSPYFFKFLFYVVFQAAGVYFNLYFLIPRYLEKDRPLRYLALLLVTILCTSACIVPGYYITAWWSGRSLQSLFSNSPANYLYFFQANALPSVLASMTLGMSVKLAKNWIEAKTRQRSLEKEKLETELKFLRSQLNPHFLFNTINSIFVLIHKNPDMASESLAKFSDLLRYQLYECNEHEIPLAQELGYLENYIELEKLRQNKGNLELALRIEQGDAEGLTIAPFVLIPFIENAFKHLSPCREGPNWIRMNLRFESRRLQFSISNSIVAAGPSREPLPYEGIGLKNVQRRLDLIYPGEHSLQIKRNDRQFDVQLRLQLHENQPLC